MKARHYRVFKKKKTGYIRIKVILRRVRVTTVTVQKKPLLHILSVCLQLQLFSMQSAWQYYSAKCGQPSSTFTPLLM